MSKYEIEEYYRGASPEWRKEVEKYYEKIGRELVKCKNEFSSEFYIRIENEVPRDVFLWLDALLRGGKVPSSCTPYMTDLFFMIH
ncbi:hypothetical protein HW511_09160 [Asaia siamensis]|uniref:Uncharacterized protein n=1 Tax=Asaia siamensis TaxID=110479 RepID=A0ABQ1LWF5_9PROT|nr:hypothetical protein [Asaia siamensis]GBR02843.1 hypothetical protein AA0323_0107 [Asaia siamensis NRIC 0323]GGC30756.1 hypothetical protein GCM10007207_15340 [Asaia siamensis]